MFPINFEKSRPARYLQCLAEGEPVGIVHTVDEILAMAGACFFALQSHGPLLRSLAAEMQGRSMDEAPHPEHKEADDELVLSDLKCAIEFVGVLSRLVQDGEYDEQFEETVRCLVHQDGETPVVTPVAGFILRDQETA